MLWTVLYTHSYEASIDSMSHWLSDWLNDAPLKCRLGHWIMQGPSLLTTTRSPYTPGLPPTQKKTKTGTYHTIGGLDMVRLPWGFPPRSKWTLRKVFHPAPIQVKLMWQFVLNRVWHIVRCMFMSGSNNREAAVLKDVITTGMRWQVTRLVCKPSLVILLA